MIVLPDAKRREVQIAALANAGEGAAEIADLLGLSRQRVCQIAKRAGIEISRRGGSRRVSAWINRNRAALLGELAEREGVSRGAMVKRILDVVLAEPAGARRLLGIRGSSPAAKEVSDE